MTFTLPFWQNTDISKWDMKQKCDCSSTFLLCTCTVWEIYIEMGNRFLNGFMNKENAIAKYYANSFISYFFHRSQGGNKTSLWLETLTASSIHTFQQTDHYRSTEAPEQIWVRINQPTLWKLPLLRWTLFLMGKAMSLGRRSQRWPKHHLQGTLISEYNPTEHGLCWSVSNTFLIHHSSQMSLRISFIWASRPLLYVSCLCLSFYLSC